MQRKRYSSPARKWQRLPLIALVTLTVGCDQLLEVQVPGQVAASSLEDPAMMESLAMGSIGEVQCSLGAYVFGTALLSDEVITASVWRNYNVWGAKLQDISRFSGLCQTSLGTDGLGFYSALARARFMTDDAYTRVADFPAEAFDRDKDQLQGMLAAYGGYAYTLLGEGFCEMAIDGGPLLTRSEVAAMALERFQTAEGHAAAAGDESIRNMALVGQARSLLNLGRMAEAAAAARQVPVGFTREAEYSTATPRRQNWVHVTTHRNRYLSVAPEYRDLTVDGVADSRVPVEDTNGVGNDNVTPMFMQMKYVEATTPIPLASWREAQLIIAEAELGQSAVDHINVLREHHGLPLYQPANVNDDAEILAQVLEERRRELFLEGHRLNDKLRHGLPFASGVNHKGEAYGPVTCHPLPEQERNANPNV